MDSVRQAPRRARNLHRHVQAEYEWHHRSSHAGGSATSDVIGSPYRGDNLRHLRAISRHVRRLEDRWFYPVKFHQDEGRVLPHHIPAPPQRSFHHPWRRSRELPTLILWPQQYSMQSRETRQRNEYFSRGFLWSRHEQE